MPVITEILFRGEDCPEGLAEDPVHLTSEERSSPHMVLETVGGRVLRISLPRGTELHDGDVLAQEGDTLVVVRATEEDLFEVAPDTPLMWGVAGFHLGNLHRPVRFRDGAMLTPADPKVADVLRESGVLFTQTKAPFVGTRYGSYAGHDHDHDHHHGHGHDHGAPPGEHAHDH
jgi:urease accessory protein